MKRRLLADVGRQPLTNREIEEFVVRREPFMNRGHGVEAIATPSSITTGRACSSGGSGLANSFVTSVLDAFTFLTLDALTSPSCT